MLRLVPVVVCGIVGTIACIGKIHAQAGASPPPSSVAKVVLTDPCGGYAELLKKYLSASPCVFVRGQASIQVTYSGTNIPIVVSHTFAGRAFTAMESSHAFGYPGALLNVGVTPSSQITIVLPSFSQISSTQTGTAAGSADTEYRYKQLIYVNRRGGVLGGVLATYKAPTGSPGLSTGAPTYEINPLLNIALNKARSIAENLSFPLANAPAAAPGQTRPWIFSPQAVTVWRSPGSTLLALIGQYNFSTHITYLTLNTAQLLSRNFQVQATYGGNNSAVDYASPGEGIGASGTAYSRSFTIGVSFLAGTSEAPPQ